MAVIKVDRNGNEYLKGRVSKLTPDRAAIILQGISDGNTIKASCAMADTTDACYFRWMREGRIHDEECELDLDSCQSAHSNAALRRFFLLSKKAQAEFESKLVANITKASNNPQQWTAAAWLLERKNPAEWGKDRSESGNPAKVELNISVDTRNKLVTALSETLNLEKSNDGKFALPSMDSSED